MNLATFQAGIFPCMSFILGHKIFEASLVLNLKISVKTLSEGLEPSSPHENSGRVSSGVLQMRTHITS